MSSMDAVKTMVEKLDNRPQGNRGYVTTTPEIIDILGQLSPRIPAGIVVEEDKNGCISVMIKVGFTLERDLI